MALLSPHASAARASMTPGRASASAVTSFDPGSYERHAHQAKEYGAGFAAGLLRYLDTGAFADVTVEVVAADLEPAPTPPPFLAASFSPGSTCPSPSAPQSAVSSPSPSTPPSLDGPIPTPSPSPIGREYRLHSLLLAHHSEFFAAALGQDHFADSAARRIRLQLDSAAAPAWPALLRFFYTERVLLTEALALPLLALSRQLLVRQLDEACADFLRGRLCAANCVAALRAAVRFALHDLHADCVALAAQSFPLLYASDLAGLPPASVLEVLRHPALQVHCELQVVEAVTRYLASTAVEPEAARELCAQIRFPYLDNATTTRLALDPGLVHAHVQPPASGAAGGGGQHAADSAGSPASHAYSSRAADFEAAGPSRRSGSGAAGAAGPVTDAAAAGAGAAAEPSTPRPTDGSNPPLRADRGVEAGSSDGGSGLLSANTSAASTPASGAGGAGPSPGCLHSARQQVTSPAAQKQQQQWEAQQAAGLLLLPAPLVPRDLALEGALARLAAMEFAASLPQPSAVGGHSPAFPGPCTVTPCMLSPAARQQQHAAAAAGRPAGPAAAAAPAAPLDAGAGGAAAAAPHAVAVNGPRPLAYFRVQGGPAPPPTRPQQQPGAAAAGGGAAVGPLAHALAMRAAGVQQPPLHTHFYYQPAHPATSAATRPPHGCSGGSGSEGSGAGAGGGTGPVASPALAGGGGGCLDPAAVFASCCLPPPRPSYCCALLHGLPGGAAWVDVALEAMWEHLVPYITVQVSGVSEGSPGNVVSTEPDCWFETNDSAEELPWVEVQLPRNVHVLHLHRYTFLHGHRRAGYFRARNFRTQIALGPAGEGEEVTAAGASSAAEPAAGDSVPTWAGVAAGQQRPGQASSGPAPAPAGRYVDLTTRMTEQFDVGVLGGQAAVGPWRCMRLQATGQQEDGVHRLCVRSLRMYGVARVDLMRQAGGFPVQPHHVRAARLEGGPGGGVAVNSGGAGGGSAAPYLGGWASP